MLFNTIDFAVFFPAVFVLYWWVCHKKLAFQNLMLLVASYFFYACWDWRFLFLLLFSTALDYFTGFRISRTANQRHRKYWLSASVCINLGFLGVFKYYNFFADSFTALFNSVGIQAHATTLQVVLPVGISFYTFHGLSYVFDIYNKKISPCRHPVNYALFVSFFPLLVAGPIERATHLLPQIEQRRQFSYEKAVSGLRQILWGLVKKMVIADSCAGYVNQIFNDAGSYSGSTLVLGAILFAFQIYGDFSGYSDIALGTARLLGIELLRNFNYPYFAKNIMDFWRRWHISLSSWFRDYLYIPLGGNRKGKWARIRNTATVFIVSGFWHGANWTFLAWGTLHASYFIISGWFIKEPIGDTKGKVSAAITSVIQIVFTFCLTTFAWIFFRATDISGAIRYIKGIFNISLFSIPTVLPYSVLGAIVVFITFEWVGRNNVFAIEKVGARWPRLVRWGFYYLLIATLLLAAGKGQQFIYFQF
jgi:alginate O-acetyltransferase complex protein AlgI